MAATDPATHTKESFTVYNVLPINSIKMETKTKIVPFNEKGYLNALKLITRSGYPYTISSIQEIDTPIGPKRCVISSIKIPFYHNGRSFKGVNNIIHKVHFACDGECVELLSSSYDLLMEIKDDPMEKIRAVIENYQFKPFDPIILRAYKFTTNGTAYEWKLGLFSKIEKRIVTVDGIEEITFLSIEGFSGDECVPYNEETKFLVGTSLSLKS